MKDADLAVEAAEDVHHLGEGAEVGFDVVGAGGFLEEDLGEAGGGGLEADFGQLGGIVAAEVINQVVLIQTVLEDQVLLATPLEVTASGPIRDIALRGVKTGVVERSDDVFVRDAIGDHAIDHVALEFGEGSDSALAAGLVAGGN